MQHYLPKLQPNNEETQNTMANHQFDLVNHPEWEITSSATTSQSNLPEVNLYVVGPTLGSMPFHINMSLEQARLMIDKLEGSCELLEATLDAAESEQKH